LPDSGVVDAERDRHIAKAIATLPPKYRLPLVLRDVEEHSYDEVAKILDLGLGTTKSRISRARGMLRERLSSYLEN
jgi:RNA polymerase sigma-70 factor (ECF subfamily)